MTFVLPPLGSANEIICQGFDKMRSLTSILWVSGVDDFGMVQY